MEALGQPPPTAADYFVLTYETPFTGKVAGPGACLIASMVSLVVYASLIYKLDLHVLLQPGKETAPHSSSATTAASMGTEEEGQAEDGAEDEDVATERERIEGTTEDEKVTNWVVLCGLRKVYAGRLVGAFKRGEPNVAVDKLSLGVTKGTCFALLGPNGAGKSADSSPHLTPMLRPRPLAFYCPRCSLSLPPSPPRAAWRRGASMHSTGDGCVCCAMPILTQSSVWQRVALPRSYCPLDGHRLNFPHVGGRLDSRA